MNAASEKTTNRAATMRPPRRAALPALFLVSILAGPASAVAPAAVAAKPAPAIVDDSATVVLDSTPAMTWRSLNPKTRDHAIVGRSRVNVKLATAPWQGKSGRIYMVLSAESGGAVKVAWRSRGQLLDGQLVPGGRSLVYSGRIASPRIEDVLDVQIEADGIRLNSVQQLRFHFEIDLE